MTLKMPTLKALLSELKIDVSFIERISKFAIDDYQLTFAEAVLLYEGAILGIADCRIGAWETQSRNIDFYNFCISAELLELLLMPNVSMLIFSKEKIVIEGAYIYRRTDIAHIKKSTFIPKSDYALNIPDSNINIDITFRDCTFGGGINLQNTQTRNLIFERVQLNYSINSITGKKESFSGMNLQVKGSLIFTYFNTETKGSSQLILKQHGPGKKGLQRDVTDPESHKQPEKADTQYSSFSQYAADINLNNAYIENSLRLEKIKIEGSINCLKIKTTNIDIADCFIEENLNLLHAQIGGILKANTLQLNGNFECSSLKAARVDLLNCKINTNLSFFRANIEGTIEINTLHLKGNMHCYNLRAYRLEMENCYLQKTLTLTFARIEHLLACITTEIIGGLDNDTDFSECYSISARGMVAGDVFLRDGFIATNGIDLFQANIKGGIDFSQSLLLSNIADGISLNLVKAKIENDLKFYPEAVCVGTVFLDDAIIGGNILFASSKFINELKENSRYTISAKNTKVGKSIRFAVAGALKGMLFDEYIKKKKTVEQINSYIPTDEKIRSQIISARQKLYEHNDTVIYQLLKKIRELGADEKSSFEKQQEEYFFLIEKDENFIKKCLLYYEKASNHLLSYLNYNKNQKDITRKKNAFLLENTIIVGESFFYGIRIAGQADFCGALLYGMDHTSIPENNITLGKKIKAYKKYDFPNALTMKFSYIEGELFLNDGPRNAELPFRACGEVNLHSSKVGQFFISPSCGLGVYSKWKIIGLKYNYIYSDEKYAVKSLLEQCEWFHHYDQENNRQPYEELAAAYLRAGDDTKARKVLLRSKSRNIAEEGTLRLLKGIAWIGIPHYRSLIALMFIFILGWFIFWRASNSGAVISIHKSASLTTPTYTDSTVVLFSPFKYSLQNLLPFINTDQKLFFSITSYSKKNFFPPWIPLYIDSGKLASFYLTLHIYLSVLFFSMFIIGITRIIKRT